MRPLLLVAALSLCQACSSDKPNTPVTDAGPENTSKLPPDLKSPSALERPPVGPGLPADLKPLGR